MINGSFTVFTFHHVSIKTAPEEEPEPDANEFTFHHVSIKTPFSYICNYYTILFTFHHVSIKTCQPLHLQQSCCLIHIPPCIY